MEQQSAYLDLTIFSAADLKRGWFSGEETSALAWVDASATKWTSIVKNDGLNVQWPLEKLTLSFNGDDNVLEGKLLTIEIYARGLLGVSLLGSVYVPLIELASDEEKKGNAILMYQIVQPSGNKEGSLKFSARVVQPASSDAPGSASGIATRPLSPTRPLEDEANGFGFKVVYPSACETRAVETDDERPGLEADLAYPNPSEWHSPENVATRSVTWQQPNESADPAHGMGAYIPPQVYPSVDADNLSHTSRAPYWPHSNYTDNIPYLHPFPPASGTSASVCPPPSAYSGSPYPPIAPHPHFPGARPHPPAEIYSSASCHPFSSCSRPFYPPFRAQQPATVHYP